MDASTSNPAPTPPRRPIFGAFVAPQKERRYWPWVLGVTAFFAVAVVIASQRDPTAYNLITPHGIKTVRLEMTPNQVTKVLGQPIAQVSDDGCYRYGWPKIDLEFDIYRVCFTDGRVSQVKTERFEVRRVLGQDEELVLPPPPEQEYDLWGKPLPMPTPPAARQ